MAKGAPDYSTDVNLRAWDGSALRAIKVDVDGQLYALMRGLFGAAYKDIAVDTNGNIVAILKGASGVNVLVDANGFMSAILKGHDGANYQNVLVDTSGRILSVIKGYDGAAYRDIKVDTSGQMIAIMKSAAGNNVAVDVSGFLAAILKGTFSTPGDKNILVDTNGQIQVNLNTQGLDRISTISKAPTGTTPVFSSNDANTATAILHTVTAGKTLMLTGATMGASCLGANNYAYLAVRNAADAIQFYIFRHKIRSEVEATNISFSLAPVPAYPIAAGWDIVVHSPEAGITSSASISGWEE